MSQQLKDCSTKSDIPTSTFAFLFAEMVHYHQEQCNGDLDALEQRLHNAGIGVGKRMLELVAFRQGSRVKRERDPVGCVHYVYNTLWRSLFNRTATGLVKGNAPTEENAPTELYLIEAEPLTNTFVTVPSNYGDVNCAAYLAGLINGALLVMGIECGVVAGWDEDQKQTVFVITISPNNVK